MPLCRLSFVLWTGAQPEPAAAEEKLAADNKVADLILLRRQQLWKLRVSKFCRYSAAAEIKLAADSKIAYLDFEA